jgi:hypothetical protein
VRKASVLNVQQASRAITTVNRERERGRATHSEGKKMSQRSKPSGKYFSLTHCGGGGERTRSVSAPPHARRGVNERTDASWKRRKMASMTVVGGPRVKSGETCTSTALTISIPAGHSNSNQ